MNLLRQFVRISIVCLVLSGCKHDDEKIIIDENKVESFIRANSFIKRFEEDLAEFYSHRNFSAVWIEDDKLNENAKILLRNATEKQNIFSEHFILSPDSLLNVFKNEDNNKCHQLDCN